MAKAHAAAVEKPLKDVKHGVTLVADAIAVIDKTLLMFDGNTAATLLINDCQIRFKHLRKILSDAHGELTGDTLKDEGGD